MNRLNNSIHSTLHWHTFKIATTYIKIYNKYSAMRLFHNQRLTGACNQALFSNRHMAMPKEVKGYFSNKIKCLP